MIRKLKAFILVLLLGFFPLAASADPNVQYALVNTTSAAVQQARVFYGVQSLATQLTVVTCYDNSAASGTIIYQNTPVLTSLLGSPAFGIRLQSGYVTCVIATSIVSPGYMILWG